MLENSLFIIASYFIAIAATLAGFGSSTLLIPLALFFMDVKTAVFIVACFHLFNNLFKIRVFWNSIDIPTFRLFGIPSILFAFAGARLITVIPVDTLKFIIAVFFIIFSLYSMWNHKFQIPQSKFTAFLGGGLSGLLAGLIGLGGAIRSSFLISFQLPKEIYVATSAAIAFVIDIIRIPTYLFGNVVQDQTYYILLPFLFVSAYFGVKTGKKLLHRISQQSFRIIVLVALFFVGIKLLF